MTATRNSPITEAQKSRLRLIAGGKSDFKMRGALTPHEQDDYSAVNALFQRGLINPTGRLKRGFSAFVITPKGQAFLIGDA